VTADSINRRIRRHVTVTHERMHIRVGVGQVQKLLDTRLGLADTRRDLRGIKPHPEQPQVSFRDLQRPKLQPLRRTKHHPDTFRIGATKWYTVNIRQFCATLDGEQCATATKVPLHRNDTTIVGRPDNQRGHVQP
jgi:hypothetical protein